MRVVLPLKDLAAAKTRLASVLSPSERRALAQAMVEDVLSVLVQCAALDEILLLSDDPVAPLLAQRYGLTHVPESSLVCAPTAGLNDVLKAVLSAKGSEQHAHLIIHGDLPALTEHDLNALLAVGEGGSTAVIACDRHQHGTNALLCPVGYQAGLAFGDDSCAQHQQIFQSAGFETVVLQRWGLSLDIDQPADLDLLQQHIEQAGPHTQRCLKLGDRPLSKEQALALADQPASPALLEAAAKLRDAGHGNVVTYSRKVFIPLTQLCRDVCHYCTFAQTPRHLEQAYLPVEEVLRLCQQGAEQGCKEALFTLGERPELRYSAARKALQAMGFETTLEYVAHVAGRVLTETGLLPHINAGCMSEEELALLRPVSASMGIMLESASERLCQKGMPHYGSPDKVPARRLETLERAGAASVPFTSGILIGIGETRRERIESLLALRESHQRHGHLQEVIIQNFRAKPGTLMASAPEPDLEELLWTIAVARLVFGPDMNIQAPPNLSPGVLPQLVAAGINDWGGVSPLTPDHVNPEAPWPHLDQLRRETAAAGKHLDERLTLYPQYVCAPERWLDPAVRGPVQKLSDASGFGRSDCWSPGEEQPVPAVEAALLSSASPSNPTGLESILARCEQGEDLSVDDVERLFQSRGDAFRQVVERADQLRRQRCGDKVSFVVNRNINYTNVCYFKCRFCAFSKGRHNAELRGAPYDISAEEIARRTREAWTRGATEVCMQGGIHPDYTGQTYLDILHTVRSACPDMHIHAFSPLEVWQGAQTLGVSLADFLTQLRQAGLDTLPGTAAEVLHDEVRDVLCPDKLNTAQWLEVMTAAHNAGFKTTATIMYGHLDRPHHWAAHLLAIRELQARTSGFTEFVPLPFVHMEAPMFLRGASRPGPTFREAVLMHAVARLVFHGLIDNIQTSWVKMGEAGVATCLAAGANDLGGTLMNESITRAAGAGHGQEWDISRLEGVIRKAGREPRVRTTLYADAPLEQQTRARHAGPLAELDNTAAGKHARPKVLAEQPLRWLDDASVIAAVFPLAACN